MNSEFRTAKAQDGVNESYSFDAIDQVTGVNYNNPANPVNPVKTVSYNYDSVGVEWVGNR